MATFAHLHRWVRLFFIHLETCQVSRDTKFCESFRELIESGTVKPIRLPARSPNLNRMQNAG